jgi:capsular exopolysaccharide synthesis family protein
MKEITPVRFRRPAPIQAQTAQTEFSYLPEPEAVSLSEYWNILKKRRYIILLLFFLVFSAGAYFALSATELYTASATVKIEPQNPQVTGLSELQPLELRGDYDYYQTQFALLRSRRLAAKVITDLRLESNKGFKDASIVSPNPVDHAKAWVSRIFGYVSSVVSPLFKSREQQGSVNLPTFGAAEIELSVPQRLLDKYLGFLAIAPVKQTRLVQIQFTTPSADLSQALANAHVESFMRMSLENRFSLTKEAREFLDLKKSELRDRLEKSEAAMNVFRRTHGVVSVEKGENIVVDRLVDLNKQLTAARAQRIEAESLYKTVENRNYRDLAEIMKQGLIQQLRSNIASLEAEKVRMGSIFKPDHPKIVELNQQLNAARQAFNSEVGTVVNGIKSSYAAALAKERALQGEAEQQQQDALRMKELGVNYAVLQEEVNANRSLYESVLKRLSETNVSKDLAVSNMQIAERAAKPQQPSAPNVSLYLLASMISGLLLGLGTAFLQEFFNSAVGTPDDVWRSIGLGTLGVVPNLKSVADKGTVRNALQEFLHSGRGITDNREAAKSLIISHAPLSMISESYRTIRTSLLLSQSDQPPQVILLTSPSPGEGKTMTSTNLAIALAHDGHSVLLVDGDMRRGTCHAQLGLRRAEGLSNVLSGGLMLEDSLHPTSVNGLHLLPRGATPPNPSELLGSRKMKDVLQELRQKFEFILIDSPPVLALSDAAVLSVVSDGVLLVFNGQTTSTAYAQRAVERLEMVHARLLGVVLNSVNMQDPHYSYYTEYGSYFQAQANGHLGGAITDIGLNGGNLGASNGKAYSGPKASDATVRTESLEQEKKWEFPLGYTHAEQGDTRAGHMRTDGDKPKSIVGGTDAVPQEFMNRLVEILMEAIGPMAPLVVRDHITLLGESRDAFPKSRVDELVQSIAPEILHGNLRSKFQTKMSQEMRNLANG